MSEPHHVADVDYTCQRCRMFVQARIPHECDPRICPQCNGTKQMWKSGWKQCDRCQGTGLLNFGESDGPIPVA